MSVEKECGEWSRRMRIGHDAAVIGSGEIDPRLPSSGPLNGEASDTR